MKVNFTVIFSKTIPVEIDYVEGETNQEITSNAIEQAKKQLTMLDWKIEVVGSVQDHIKNMIRNFKK